MKSSLVVLALIAFAAAGLAFSQDDALAKNDKALAELSWMAGAWKGSEGATMTEEIWMTPGGGMMPGLHRDLKEGRRAFFEYLRIESKADGVYYQASPMGKTATPFKLKESGKNRVVFENPTHDFPQRIIYSLEGKDRLKARIEGEEGGKSKSSEWTWSRQK